MNIYDFDGTIYNGFVWLDFMLFCVKKNPKILPIIRNDLVQLIRLRNSVKKGVPFSETYCSYLKHMGNIDSLLEEFWDKSYQKIKDLYFALHQNDDVIITGSPEFLIEPICEMLGIEHLIGSKINPHTGELEGNVCYSGEKVSRFREDFGDIMIDNGFTDDYRLDHQLLELATNKYLIKGSRIVKIKDSKIVFSK